MAAREPAGAATTATIARSFDAPPRRVREARTDPAQPARWFNEAPGATTEVHAPDVRPGGLMRPTIPPDPPFHPALGSCVRLLPVAGRAREPGRLAVVDPGRRACAMARVRFEPDGGRTRLALESTLLHEAAREPTVSAWGRCLDKLADLVNDAIPRTCDR